MADNEDIEGAIEDSANGHLIQYSIRFRYFVERLPFGFERSFDFECNSCPTSWMFRVDFGVNEVDQTLFCTIFIRRDDEQEKLVQVKFTITLFAFPLRDIPPKILPCKDFPSRRATRRTFNGILQYQDRAQIDDQGVLVQVSFAVRGCHMDEDLKELITRRKAKEPLGPSFALYSKM